ncbi:MAG: hypothetical protein JXA90_14965, partial [Planctomycetes bacterium]|nr:hypothetical protein [Planctomycetota bacterium]
MRHRWNSSLLAGLCLFLLLTGCAPRGALSEKLQTIDELRRELEGSAEALAAARRTEEALVERLSQSLCENERLGAALEAHGRALAASGSQTAVLEAERGELVDRMDAQAQRLMALEMERDRLEGERLALGEERRALLESGRSGAERDGSAADGRTAGAPGEASPPDGSPPGLEGLLLGGVLAQRLERLDAYRQRLLQRALEANRRIETEGVAAAPLPNCDLYRDDARGLWEELSGLVRERLRRIASREARWDSTDLSVLAAIALAGTWLLGLIRAPVRWLQSRRHRREMLRLKRRICELEVNPALMPGGPRLAARALGAQEAAGDLAQEEAQAGAAEGALAESSAAEGEVPQGAGLPAGEAAGTGSSGSLEGTGAGGCAADTAGDGRGADDSAVGEEEREAASLEASKPRRPAPSVVAPVQIVVGGRLASSARETEPTGQRGSPPAESPLRRRPGALQGVRLRDEAQVAPAAERTGALSAPRSRTVEIERPAFEDADAPAAPESRTAEIEPPALDGDALSAPRSRTVEIERPAFEDAGAPAAPESRTEEIEPPVLDGGALSAPRSRTVE